MRLKLTAYFSPVSSEIGYSRLVKAHLAILLVILISTITTTPGFAAPLAYSAENWHYVNGNSWAWNYSPQTQINKDNVDRLEVKWVFPIESKSQVPEALRPINPWEGVTTPPVINDGIVYIQTNFLKTYAVDTKTGRQLWAHSYIINVTEIQRRLPWVPRGLAHLHGIRYWEGGDAVLLLGYACDMYALDGKTGNETLHIKDLCLDIPGNIYSYAPAPEQNAIGTYEKGRQFIFLLSHVEGGGFVEGGRNVAMGIDMNTEKVLWRVFNAPPQDRPSKDWALEECDRGFFRDIPCRDVAAKARKNLEWDWAPAEGKPPHSSSGVTAAWGQPVVDEDTGVLYINTGAQVPWPNISFTLGPRLYGSTILAIDMEKGQRIWWQQPQPRDPYDYDCNWSGMLIDNPTLGKVYVKGCKEGHWIVSDAVTGEPKHIIQILDEIYPEKRTFHITDPLSKYDMREWKWPENSRYHGTPPVPLVPSFVNGAFSTDQSYDPESGLVYHYAALMQLRFSTLPSVRGRLGGAMYETNFPANVTIVARDLVTGDVKWSWFYPFSNQRAHMLISGGMLFTGFTDGQIRFFDKDSGELLHKLNLGSPIVTGITTGQDSDGDQKIFVLVGATRFAWQTGYGLSGQDIVSGTLVSIGLSKMAPKVVTSTVITTTTVTHYTTPSTSVLDLVAYVSAAIAVIALLVVALLIRGRR